MAYVTDTLCGAVINRLPPLRQTNPHNTHQLKLYSGSVLKMADTAAPSPTASVAPSIRGDPPVGSSAGPGGLVVPEGMVVVWDDTQKLFVVKDRNEVRPKTWRTRLRDAAWKFWAGGPPLG